MDHRVFQGDLETGATYGPDILVDIEAMSKSRFSGSLGRGKAYYALPPDVMNKFMQEMKASMIKVGNDTLEQVLKPKGIVPLSGSINKDKLLETYISMS